MKKILIPIILSLFLAIGSMLFISYEEDISIIFFNSYDTNIPSYILIGFFAVIIIFITIFSTSDVFKYFRGNREKKNLFANGRDAQAKIISLDEAGDGTITTINEQPLVALELEIQDGSKPLYKVKLETLISRLDIARLQPESIVKVKIDPDDPNNVVLS